MQAVTDDSQPIQEDENEPTEQAEEPEETKPVSKTEAKPESKTEAKPASKPVTQSSIPASQPKDTPTVDPVKVHGDLAQNNPNFVSEQALQNWLQFGSGAYETERGACLMQATQNNRITYYRPSNELSQFVSLNKIEYHAPSQTFKYYYYFSDGKCLDFSINTNQSTDFYDSYVRLYDSRKQMYLDGDQNYGCTIDQNTKIEFYYQLPSDGNLHIFWKQNSLIHSVYIQNHYDQLSSLIPLLVLQQVTIPLNTDLITQ